MKNYKVRVLHMSHTDIGYKDIQSKIISLQSENMLDIILKNKSGDLKGKNWKWNIECFGILENFIKSYPEHEKELIKQIDKGLIGVSANYWNFSKLPGRHLIASAFKRVAEFNKKIQKNITSLITNDVNGYACSWAEEANKVGVNNLFFGLHTHHGYFPAFRKQYPFWWELPNGKKVLVWIGEQYAFGNNMGLVPGPMSDYITKDGKTCGTGNEEIILANERIQKYISELDKTGYDFDVIPITVLGTGADNDPANYDIADRCKLLEKEWSKYGVSEVKMITLDEFFDEVKKDINLKSVPTYKGEWPDWWTDGVGAAPQANRAFREAQRNYKFISKLNDVENMKQKIESIEDNLLLYSEHTFGTEDPIQYGHSQYNFTVEKIKQTFAFNALNDSLTVKDGLSKWKSYRQYNEEQIKFKVKNMSNIEVSKTISLNRYLGWSEISKIANCDNLTFIDEKHNVVPYSISVIPHPSEKLWDHKDIHLHVNLGANHSKIISLDLKNAKNISRNITSPFSTVTAEMSDDVDNKFSPKNGISLINDVLNTEFYKIVFDGNGIKQIFNNISQKNIINENHENLFSPVYFVDKIPYVRKELFLQRRIVGKNKIANTSTRHDGQLINKVVEISNKRDEVKIKLYYKIESCKFYEVVLALSNYHSRIDVEVNLNKDTEWSMESMLISLPFSGKVKLDYDNIYEIDKGQIPGTLIDYHSIQEGIIFNNDIVINQLDAPLVWTGPLSFGERSLSSNIKHDQQSLNTYTWALNNVWETNFPADTSGFHSFRYIISNVAHKQKIDDLIEASSTEFILERI